MYISNSDVEERDEGDDLKEDFETLYAEGILSDVQLRTATQTFNAHKNILSARSPVFRAMFSNDMMEKVQECVPVPDLEADTVRRMLLYMYTKALKDLHWESAMKLYAAADKYEIVALKTKCSSFLICNLCPSNLCEVLVLADMHADDNFKRVAQDYALLYEEEVFSSDEWNEFAKNNGPLAAETMLRKWNGKKTEGR
ncbi:TD and POZ domain-containing protein 4 [Trichonephila inaurata madagascariensis]|uniref:TD and POZ domain-containing protein 4 n=1 Tax=Trichonephila inaurata madagascariensis TaxID=2747483 RepID=A0A8X6YN43_9ARAC|nr:TD and POZ domain-containing protein 4 [Trichonephila inaurata madagascariensis]